MPRSNADDWNPPEAFVEGVLNDALPKIQDSSFFLSLCPGDGGAGDVKFWVELGAAVMCDKPIIAIVPVAEHDKYKVPRKLRILADSLVFAPDGLNEQVADDLRAALKRHGLPAGG